MYCKYCTELTNSSRRHLFFLRISHPAEVHFLLAVCRNAFRAIRSLFVVSSVHTTRRTRQTRKKEACLRTSLQVRQFSTAPQLYAHERLLANRCDTRQIHIPRMTSLSYALCESPRAQFMAPRIIARHYPSQRRVYPIVSCRRHAVHFFIFVLTIFACLASVPRACHAFAASASSLRHVQLPSDQSAIIVVSKQGTSEDSGKGSSNNNNENKQPNASPKPNGTTWPTGIPATNGGNADGKKNPQGNSSPTGSPSHSPRTPRPSTTNANSRTKSTNPERSPSSGKKGEGDSNDNTLPLVLGLGLTAVALVAAVAACFVVPRFRNRSRNEWFINAAQSDNSRSKHPAPGGLPLPIPPHQLVGNDTRDPEAFTPASSFTDKPGMGSQRPAAWASRESTASLNNPNGGITATLVSPDSPDPPLEFQPVRSFPLPVLDDASENASRFGDPPSTQLDASADRPISFPSTYSQKRGSDEVASSNALYNSADQFERSMI